MRSAAVPPHFLGLRTHTFSLPPQPPLPCRQSRLCRKRGESSGRGLGLLGLPWPFPPLTKLRGAGVTGTAWEIGAAPGKTASQFWVGNLCR